MKKTWSLSGIVILILVLIAVPARIKGQKAGAPDFPSAIPTNQIIIQFADETAQANLLGTSGDQELPVGEELPALSQAAGVTVTYFRPMSGDAHVLRLPTAVSPQEATQLAAEMAQLEGVAYAEPDLIKTVDGREHTLFTPELTPNDTYFNQQWHYHYTPGTSEGLNLINAWNMYTGSNSTVVAVIDTGILNHNDLAGKTVAGYDFISTVFNANDGDGRDSNPADPGDWVTANECGYLHSAQPSSWHGTHVAGTIGAATNNSLGVAGVNWHTRILPVRVLGKCGGYTSDIVDGMRWAAGLSVSGVPANANPADVLNMSLGGQGSCSTTEQNAVNAIVAAGAVVAVAAGNDDNDASLYSPASCNNVITVASTNRNGNKASYSNYGSVVELSAPGGEGISTNGVLSTLDSGTQGPANDHSYAFYSGTSMATPHVAGVASLIKGLQPGYTPAQVLSLLQSTVRAFPGGSTCNTSLCGAGIVDAYWTLVYLTVDFDNEAYLPLVAKPSPPPPPPPPANPFINPGFELGSSGWTEYSSNNVLPLIIDSGFPGSVTPHNGSWAVWLGGVLNEVSYIQQSVTVPTTAPYLAYWHWIASQDFCGFDVGYVQVNANIVQSYDLCDTTSTGGWVLHTVNLGAYSGQTISLRIGATTDYSLNSNLFVDDVSFQASASAPAAQPIPPGAQAAVPKTVSR